MPLEISLKSLFELLEIWLGELYSRLGSFRRSWTVLKRSIRLRGWTVCSNCLEDAAWCSAVVSVPKSAWSASCGSQSGSWSSCPTVLVLWCWGESLSSLWVHSPSPGWAWHGSGFYASRSCSKCAVNTRSTRWSARRRLRPGSWWRSAWSGTKSWIFPGKTTAGCLWAAGAFWWRRSWPGTSTCTGFGCWRRWRATRGGWFGLCCSPWQTVWWKTQGSRSQFGRRGRCRIPVRSSWHWTKRIEFRENSRWFGASWRPLARLGWKCSRAPLRVCIGWIPPETRRWLSWKWRIRDTACRSTHSGSLNWWFWRAGRSFSKLKAGPWCSWSGRSTSAPRVLWCSAPWVRWGR